MSDYTPAFDPIEGSKYLFIDGGYLRAVIKAFDWYWPLSHTDIDYEKLASALGSPTKVFYYDCLSPKKTDESDDDHRARNDIEHEFFESLRALRGWHVVEGHMRAKRRGKPATQKEVDVAIAVDMLTHTYNRNMQQIRFVAGDRDFRPLVAAVVRAGMYIEVLSESKGASQPLLNEADSGSELPRRMFIDSLNSEFLEKHPIPTSNYRTQDGSQHPRAIEYAMSKGGRIAEMFEHATGYAIRENQPQNPHRPIPTYLWVYIGNDDIDVLKKCHSEVTRFKDVEWKPRGE